MTAKPEFDECEVQGCAGGQGKSAESVAEDAKSLIFVGGVFLGCLIGWAVAQCVR